MLKQCTHEANKHLASVPHLLLGKHVLPSTEGSNRAQPASVGGNLPLSMGVIGFERCACSSSKFILQGGKEAARSNAILHRIITDTIEEVAPEVGGGPHRSGDHSTGC